MSAFVLNKSHINAIIQAGLNVQHKPFTWYHKNETGELEHHQLTSDNADQIGQMLLDECVHSVQYRYEDSDSIANLPGPSNAEWLIPFVWKPFVKTATPVETIKNIRCYEYQSCEHPEWEGSNAHDFCEALRHCVESQLPGYDEAPWEWDDPGYYESERLAGILK